MLSRHQVDEMRQYSAVDTERQGVLGLRDVAEQRIAVPGDRVQGATPECDRHWKSVQIVETSAGVDQNVTVTGKASKSSKPPRRFG